MYTYYDEQQPEHVNSRYEWSISKCVLTLFLCIAIIINLVNIVAAIWLFIKIVFNAQGLKNTLYSLFLTPLYILRHYDISNPKL